ncbi:nucleoplasmin-3 [Microcaecilia unicolor]|uniref:Nucleoplasmin-3 n=1 Tax=Microcaecilia unicolor TaxID=1415580 RepID=A0A6P7Y6N9_9AMPH|nr:nucleoplasmin-3 [Microcaecilia unicolor]
MAAFLKVESGVSMRSRDQVPARAESFLFGCELSASTPTFTFKVDEDDGFEHILAVQMVCLGEGVQDECNIVEAVALNHLNKEIAIPIANLKLTCQSMVNLEHFDLQPPVSFRLKSGSGPVYVTGHHLIVHDDVEDTEESDFDDSEELDYDSEGSDYDSEIEEGMITPIKPVLKKQSLMS